MPLGAVALVMTERALRRLPRNDRPHRLDVIGAVLMVGAALALMLALSLGGSHNSWTSWRIVTLFASSAALWVLFALRLLTAREPFIPLAILHGRVTSTITISAFFSIGTVIGVTIYMPLYCQTVLGASASISGLALIAYMGGATLGSLVSTRFIVRIKHYMRVPIGGLIVAVLVLGVLATNPAQHSLTEVVALLFVLGLGLGPMYPVSTIVMQNTVKPHQLGTATGTLNFFRTLGGAIVVAIFGAIVLSGMGRGRLRRRSTRWRRRIALSQPRSTGSLLRRRSASASRALASSWLRNSRCTGRCARPRNAPPSSRPHG